MSRDRGGIVYGVHYEVPLDDAKAHFEAAGFEDIRDLTVAAEWRSGQSSYNCDEMRERARRFQREGQGLAFYQGSIDWSSRKCRVYRFAYGRYTGPIGDLGHV